MQLPSFLQGRHTSKRALHSPKWCQQWTWTACWWHWPALIEAQQQPWPPWPHCSSTDLLPKDQTICAGSSKDPQAITATDGQVWTWAPFGQHVSIFHEMATMLMLIKSTLFFINMMCSSTSMGPNRKAQLLAKVKHWTLHVRSKQQVNSEPPLYPPSVSTATEGPPWNNQ